MLLYRLLMFSMKELEKDMTMLRAGMKEVGREIEFYRGQPVQPGDRLVFIKDK